MVHPSNDIDVTAAVSIIRADLARFALLDVTLLGEGTDHLAFDLGGRYVIRFPKRAETAAALLGETKLLAWLAPQLPLAVPVYEFVRSSAREARGTYAGYAKLPGTPALHFEIERLQFTIIGAHLGSVLRRLHDVDVEEAAALGVAQDDDPRLDEWSHDALADLTTAVERGHVSSDLARQWERVLMNRPSTEHVPRRLIHGDFAAEHVLLDEQGTPTAIIDWSDAALGDPARDLSGILHWGGHSLLQAALGTYGDVDERTVRRAHWFAVCRAVADIVFGEEAGLDAYVRAGKKALTWLSQPESPRSWLEWRSKRR